MPYTCSDFHFHYRKTHGAVNTGQQIVSNTERWPILPQVKAKMFGTALSEYNNDVEHVELWLRSARIIRDSLARELEKEILQ